MVAARVSPSACGYGRRQSVRLILSRCLDVSETCPKCSDRSSKRHVWTASMSAEYRGGVTGRLHGASSLIVLIYRIARKGITSWTQWYRSGACSTLTPSTMWRERPSKPCPRHSAQVSFSLQRSHHGCSLGLHNSMIATPSRASAYYSSVDEMLSNTGRNS